MSLKQAIAELEALCEDQSNMTVREAHFNLIQKAQALLLALKSAEVGKFQVHSCEFTDKHNMHLTISSDRCMFDDSGTIYFSPTEPKE